jgi:two-component sensor histidine kinase
MAAKAKSIFWPLTRRAEFWIERGLTRMASERRTVDLATANDVLLRETLHRCGNDLQLVVSLLSMQSRRAKSLEVREALADTAKRVVALARARTALNAGAAQELPSALGLVCEALQSQVDGAMTLIAFDCRSDGAHYTGRQISALAMVVNELVTNAIKHAFIGEEAGRVDIRLFKEQDGLGEMAEWLTVTDNGRPFASNDRVDGSGFGQGIVRQLVAAADGELFEPVDGSKCFRIRLPASQTG